MPTAEQKKIAAEDQRMLNKVLKSLGKRNKELEEEQRQELKNLQSKNAASQHKSRNDEPLSPMGTDLDEDIAIAEDDQVNPREIGQ